MRNSLAVNKFYQFIIPNTAKAFAVSISEFIDALIVTWLLGSKALAIVNLGHPILLIVSTLTVLFSVGGSTLYASACGAFDKTKADKILTVSTITLFVLSCIFMMGGLCMRENIISWLCVGDKHLIDLSGDYLSILIASTPVLALSNLLFGFLSSAGKPKLSSWLMILANVVNITLDVVFIKYMEMGIKGAAYATICGYAVALLVYMGFHLQRKVNMSFIGITAKDLHYLKSICSMGSSVSVSQLSLAIKIAACNSIALYFGGHDALVAFSVCIQLLSFTSIFVGGIGSSMLNITATLRGQKDFLASGHVINHSYILILVSTTISFILFYIFAPHVAIAYNAFEDEVLNVTVYAIRIFSLSIIVRSEILVFMFYVQSIDKSVYATFISLFDGVLGHLPIALICCLLWGIDGLWWSFPASSILLALIIVMWNFRVLNQTTPSPFRNIMLVERDMEVIAEDSGTEVLTSVGDSNLINCEWVKSQGWEGMLSSYLNSLLMEKTPVHLDYLIRQYPDKLLLDIHSNVDHIPNKTVVAPANTHIKNEMILDMNSLRAYCTTSL